MIKNVLRMNRKSSALNILILVMLATHIFWYLSSSESINKTFSYSITVTYAYIYATIFIPHKNLFRTSYLLQRSLPICIKDIVNGFYYSTYISITLIYILNLIATLIIIPNEYSLGNMLITLFSALMTLFSLNIVAPLIIKSSNNEAIDINGLFNKVLYWAKNSLGIIISFSFLIITLGVCNYFISNKHIDVLIISNLIIGILYLSTFRLSNKLYRKKLLYLFD